MSWSSSFPPATPRERTRSLLAETFVAFVESQVGEAAS